MAYGIDQYAQMIFTIKGTLYGQTVMNTMRYRYTSPTPIINGQAALGEFIAEAATGGGLYELWRDCVSTSVINIELWAQWIWPARYHKVVQFPVLSTGAWPSFALPANSAMVVSRGPDLAIQGKVSNLHLPGVGSSSQTDGVLGVPVKLKLELFAQRSIEFILTASGWKFEPIVAPRLMPDVDWLYLTNNQVNPYVRVMRRRTVGLGI